MERKAVLVESLMTQCKVSKFAHLIIFLLMTCLLAACGGGGSSSNSPSTGVSGVASKGPIKGGTVNVYAVNADGSRGKLLGTAQTNDADGSYEVTNLAYSGNIIVIVTGGTYVDEATGNTLDNPGMKAALPSASGSVKVAVTPLTDVAFKQMSSATGSFSSANISKYNSVVSTAFGVDIIGTQPVDVTNSALVANARQASIDYGVALAAISQMVSNGDASNVIDAIQQIQADLSSSTPQLTTTGTALTSAITSLINVGGILAPTITADTISVANAIEFSSNNEVNPPSNPTGVAQAKGLISDLRNTVLSVVNYNTGDVTTVIKTPFDAAVQDIETVVQPELTGAADRIGWVVTSLGNIDNITADTTYTSTDQVNHPGETLTITTAATGYTVTISIQNATTTLVSGTATINDITNPTSGSLNFTTLKTASGNATVTAAFSGAMSGQIYTSMTLTGNITTPVATFDFSDASKGQKMTANFAQVPGSVDSMMLTKAYFKGVAATNKVRLTGIIDLPSLVWNSSGRGTIPTSATISAKIEALSNGSATLTLDGTLTGAFSNAATYDKNLDDSASNFPNWSGTFNGSLVATSGLNISVLLKASMPSYQIVNFETKYTRVLPDNTTIFLNCTGTSNIGTDITTANMTNQDGMRVALSYDDNLADDSQFSGTIKTSGGETVANFSTLSGIPRVTYADNYFETLM